MSYSWDIQETFFRNLLALRDADSHVEIFTGDLLHDFSHDDQITEEAVLGSVLAYDPRRWSTLNNDDFATALASTMIYVLAVQGLGRETLHLLDGQLRKHASYLGSLEINPADQLHWTVYRDRLVPRYRYISGVIRLFYPKFEEDEGADVRDWGRAKELSKLPFRSVEWEDVGFRHTVFDQFETPAHAKRVAELERCLFGHLGHMADEILLRTRVLNPQLQTTLHAAVKAFEYIETPEQVAHVALSCRRFLEALADSLYPPRKETANGRNLGSKAYRNRLWAYIEQQLKGSEHDLVLTQLQDIGNRLERLDSMANKGLHAQSTRSEIRRVIIGVLVLGYDLLSMTPFPTQGAVTRDS
jgi:hypothetical protein